MGGGEAEIGGEWLLRLMAKKRKNRAVAPTVMKWSRYLVLDRSLFARLHYNHLWRTW